MLSRKMSRISTITVVVLLASCGSSNDSPSTPTTTTPTTTTPTTTAAVVSGNVVKGNVAQATVTIKNAATGATLGTGTTDANGAYSISITFNGDVIVEASGGTYTDEATNQSTALSTPLRSVITVNGNTTTMVTPLTTMAYANAFPSATAAVTAAAFKTQADNVAKLFKLTTPLTTTKPTVSGADINDYGRALAGLSRYMQANSATLASVTAAAFNSDQWAKFVTAYNSAYKLAFPNLTFSLDGTAFNITGTGIGTGSCGIAVQGSVTANGISVPINFNYCINGIAAGSCAAGNASISQALSGQSGLAGGVNLTYQYSSTCAAGAITINLK